MRILIDNLGCKSYHLSSEADKNEKQEDNPLREVIQLIFICNQLSLSELFKICKMLKITVL